MMGKYFTITALLLLCLWCGSSIAQSSRITGKVTGQDKEPLPGVNILISGSSQGTVTDADGKFAIDVPVNASLVFSFIGIPLTRRLSTLVWWDKK
ncbi:carboxypeptidase-like regulatory domain-containing protein [Dyadobacter pollutisoli]|uniref:Carboxypeptidase-like regulatory domain-containing protein n=1 Tax=Dyadobacter pollutisoli TaxID=2910158 RepID=A0A9E8NCL0_9BACT|nr:carboxypeptidase-like regulatory domain-containing protein [Dyadobacter pollutisoli]WAC14194.1 carboxypeptidase-like regulatory domain-containing protein [Dyadobacter pollutisoli]